MVISGMPWTCRQGRKGMSGGAQHCAVCHETFSSTSAGDKHRVGPWTARRCLSPEEMQEAGLRRNSRGVWAIASKTPWWEGLR